MNPENQPVISYPLKDGSTLKIREALPEDASLLLAYIESVSGESANLTFGPGEFDFTRDEERQYLEDIRKVENAIYLLGFIGEELVSALSFTCEQRVRTRHVGEFGITVKKRYWGKSIGKAMLETLIDWAQVSRIIYKINLSVRSDNERAIALYKKCGFTVEGLRTRDICIEGKFYDSIMMGLEINPPN